MIEIKLPKDFKDLSSLVKSLYQLDLLVFPDMPKDALGRIDKWLKVVKKNLEVHQILLVKKEIVGYIHLTPLTKEAYDLLIKGKLPDGELTPEHIEVYDKAKPLYLYLLSLVIHPHEQGKGYSRLLWKAAKDHLQKKINLGYSIHDVVTVSWTTEGTNFLEKVGAEKISQDSHGNPVLRLKLEKGNLYP